MQNSLKKALMGITIHSITIVATDVEIVKQNGSRNTRIALSSILGPVKLDGVATSLNQSRVDVSKWVNDDESKVVPKQRENIENLNFFVNRTILGVGLYESKIGRGKKLTVTLRTAIVEPETDPKKKPKTPKIETVVFSFTQTK